MSAQEKKLVVVLAERDPNADGSVKGVPEPVSVDLDPRAAPRVPACARTQTASSASANPSHSWSSLPSVSHQMEKTESTAPAPIVIGKVSTPRFDASGTCRLAPGGLGSSPRLAAWAAPRSAPQDRRRPALLRLTPDLCAPQTLIREGGKIFPSEFVRSAIESKNSDLLVAALNANYDDLQTYTRQTKTDRDVALKSFKKSNTTHYEFSQLLELKGVLKLEHQASLHKIEVDKLKTDQAAEKQQAYEDRKKAWEEANEAKIVALQQAEFKDEPEVDA